ncbi:hypothetical protein B0H16DRAFT_1459560 [Mycena metata]|uniref:Uncharacterized protein n=1 Tax=Mycena metata TaxID=1033252 RepID=A0AAD7J003_9AGAR|nr:hypothetical protein B0H16DRAFT_1459560 [Mycena metata]
MGGTIRAEVVTMVPPTTGKNFTCGTSHRVFLGQDPQNRRGSKHQKGSISSIWAPFGLSKGLLESPRSGLSASEVGTTSEDIVFFAISMPGSPSISSRADIQWVIGLVLGLLESPELELSVGKISGDKPVIWPCAEFAIFADSMPLAML